ncbi:DLIC-domain-containing protein [Tothia fuscella]|uniref:DLIC-domain-containing protein n=1 Tax=Tothia fuscella TaxID=1048955 RepID=A0A9P4NYL3_9PEZI|nr:DLIC-domain-containing protein [Tothia fuscella]
MASTSQRTSINPFATNTSDIPDQRKSQTAAAPRKEIWSSLLKSVSTGKRMPEKQLLLLGGTPETQREFLESLSTETPRTRRPQSRKAPIANQYALGYTYQDVLDADHEDVLARLSVYTVADPSLAFSSLLKPLLTPKTLPNTLIVILLDWGQPWNWIRHLRDWIRLLRTIMISLDDESKDIMEETIVEWRDRKRNSATEGSTSNDEPTLPLGPGEWDEPLGVPLCVVCQNADKMQQLETERSWKDEQFDFVGQYIRTILLKHGASLIYTMPSAPGSLQALIHSSLGIQSTLQKKELKHEVSNRDKTLVPPNWDSWGKIRLMADNFDVEAISKIWSLEIQLSEAQATAGADKEEVQFSSTPKPEPNGIDLYERRIRDPKKDALMPGLVRKPENGIETESREVQSFLAEQAEILENLRKEDEKEKLVKDAKKTPASYLSSTDDRRDVEEHIGPVQFNMGGIQVDADDMLKRLKDREATRTTDSEPKTPTGGAKVDQEAENKRLKDFFANLAKKPSSATNSPRRGGTDT